MSARVRQKEKANGDTEDRKEARQEARRVKKVERRLRPKEEANADPKAKEKGRSMETVGIADW